MKKTANDNAAKLNRLNKIYKEVERLSDKYIKAHNKFLSLPVGDPAWKSVHAKVEEARAKYEEASKKFDVLRKELPLVKFNMSKGEYFYADAGDGQEMFAVKIRRRDYALIMVAARSSGEAEDKAKMMFAEKEKVPLLFLEAEDYSR